MADDDDSRIAMASLQLSEQAEEPAVDLWSKALEKLPAEQRSSIADHTSDPISSGQVLIDQLLKLANEKQALAATKAWKLKLSDKNYKLRAVAGNIAAWLTRFRGVVDVAVSFDPVHAALPWAAVRFILQAVTADNEFSSHLLVGIEKVSYLVLRGKMYERLYLQPESGIDTQKRIFGDDGLWTKASPESALVDLYTEILSFLFYAMSYLGKTTARRTVHAIFHPGAFADFVSKLEQLEHRAESSISVCARFVERLEHQDVRDQINRLDHSIHAPVLRLDSRLKELLCLAESVERCEMLQWISTVPHETDHYNARKGRLEGTADWLLARDKYVEWRNSPSSAIFWLHGIPGAGKTKLSSKAVDDVRARLSNAQDQETLAYFYCDANRSSHSSSLAILRSMVKQLSTPLQNTDDKSIISVVADIYRNKQSQGFPSDGLTTEDCQGLLPALINSYPQVTLVIDGLDECQRSDRQDLMDIIDDLLETADGLLKVFIASRNDTDLTERYRDGHHVEVCCDDNGDDIQRFVESKLQQNRWCQRHMSKSVRDQVLETFKRKSQGMFQWAALHIEELLDLRDNTDIQTYIEGLPLGLKNAYDRVWRTIQSKRGRAGIIAERTFQWLMCSHEPLSPELLMLAVCQDPAVDFCPNVDITMDYILDACHNLIKMDRADNRMDPRSGHPTRWMRTMVQITDRICRFSHLSVQEYFEEHHWSVDEAHCLVGQVCLRVWMSSLHLSTRLDFTAFWPEENRFSHLDGQDIIRLIEEDLLERQRKRKDAEMLQGYFNSSGMVDYATHWYIHFQAAQDVPLKDRVARTLRTFLGRPGCSSPYYRKWCAWLKLQMGGLLGELWHFLNHCAPFSAPEFGCAALALESVFRDWLEEGALAINRQSESGATLLGLASGAGRISLCRLLLDNGAAVEPQTDSRLSPLMKAAGHGHREIARLLIGHGADVNTGGHHTAPLLESKVLSDPQFIRMLLENGADPNIIRREEGKKWSPLINAASIGQLEAVQLLLQHGADINLRVDGLYHTALCAATHGGGYDADSNIFDFLLNSGAEADIVGGFFGSALGAAITSRSNVVGKVYALLDADAVYRSADYLGVDLNYHGGQGFNEALECVVEAYMDGEPQCMVETYLFDKRFKENRMLRPICWEGLRDSCRRSTRDEDAAEQNKPAE